MLSTPSPADAPNDVRGRETREDKINLYGKET